ncbi:MAG: hypothetical protein HQL69_23265 [Magnetococcales bacterium]|nr:hypothetical protein [Magnetococcales bacterium]
MSTPPEILGTLRISQAESLDFAKLSGDYNPIHVDMVAARRMVYGGTVVHGIHACLLAVAMVLRQSGATKLSLNKLQARFSSPIRQGELVQVIVKKRQAGNVHKLTLECNGIRAQSISLDYSAATVTDIENSPDESTPALACRKLLFTDARRQKGEVELVLDKEALGRLMPAVAKHLPYRQTSQLLSLTRIVGMICPGEDSLFTKFSLTFSPGINAVEKKLRYKVTTADERFARITMGVDCQDLVGEVHANFRTPFVKQASYEYIAAKVTPKAFAGQRAIVIGGSRGLGEVTAKLIAAGGGVPLITYYRGEDDARLVQSEIHAGHGNCEVMEFNVLKPSFEQMSSLFSGLPPSNLYYFATPPIRFNNSGTWNAELYATYHAYFVEGYSKTIETMLKCWPDSNQGLTIFNPSSIFLDKPESGAAEYIVAKGAAEAYGQYLNGITPNITVHNVRLPRISTDQTSGVDSDKLQDPLQIMLEVLS